MNRHRYEDDVLAWTQEQATLLRAGDVSALDLENLAEEIESLGTSQKRELRSRLGVLIQHLLKYQFQPEQQSRSWRATINVQRRDIDQVIQDSPSLRRLIPDLLGAAYRRGRDDALEETGLLRLPDECPFTIEQILDPEWLPD